MEQSLMIVTILLIVMSVAHLATGLLVLTEQREQARLLDTIRIQLGFRQAAVEDGISVEPGEDVEQKAGLLGKGVQLQDGTFVPANGAA